MARIRYIPNRVIDANGIADGATIGVYQTGTLTPVSIYSDAGFTTPLANPYTVAAGAAVPEIFANYDPSDLRVRVLSDGGSVISDDDPYDPLADASAVDAKVDKDGTDNVRVITDASNPEAYAIEIQSIADGKQVDGIYGYHEIESTASSAGYVFHGVTYSATGVGEFAGGGVGGACGGPGGGSGVIGNRGDDGLGHGGIFSRLGSGPGNGVYGIAQGTGDGSAGYFFKQNPVDDTAGDGPAVYARNDSTNGQALYARTASANTDSNTVVVERLNGTEGTGLYTRITGVGPRTGVLIGGSTQVIPSASSTGSSAVYGYDVQINANITGAETRGLNLANSSAGSGESYGAVILVDGARTTSYGLFVNVANAGTNYGIYVTAGLSYFGGNANAASQYQVAGTKVIGAQGAAVADATDAASAITQLNALLARCRAHGLIAT